MPKQEPHDLQLALGCVEYEMLVLATALIMRRDSSHERLRFPDAVYQLVFAALLVKARSLVEFLLASDRRRITVKSFGLTPTNDRVLRSFYGWVSQHSVHLEWKRARDPLVLRESKYDEALHVLRESARVCERIRERGIDVRAERHRRRQAVLQAQLADLGLVDS
jgi:hypothetical protein